MKTQGLAPKPYYPVWAHSLEGNPGSATGQPIDFSLRAHTEGLLDIGPKPQKQHSTKASKVLLLKHVRL